MKRLPINLFFTICLLLILFASCQVKTPEDIIQPDKMETLLYDYHIVQAMGNDVNSMQEYHVKLYYEYLFKKHDVTKALFDSSLVWYTRHPAHLTKIYANLKERLDNEVTIMQEEKNLEKAMFQISEDVTIDTLELWTGMSVTELTRVPYNNRLLFSFKSDSAFVAGDSLVLRLNTRFFSEQKKLQNMYAAILVAYKNAPTKSYAINIDKSGSYTLQVPRDYDSTIKELSGFIYYNDNDDSIKSGVVLSDLSLLRIHPPITEEFEADSIQKIEEDSILKVSDDSIVNVEGDTIPNIESDTIIKEEEK